MNHARRCVKMAHDVFISYANEDKTIAYAVCANLEERRIRCWIAPRDVSPGVYYAQAIIKAIKESRVMALIFSSNANKSQHVVREAEQAVRGGIPIIPFRIDTSSPAETLNYYIGPQHWLDAATPPLAAHVQQLGDAITLLLKTSAEHLAPDEAASSGPSEQVLGTTTLPDGATPAVNDELMREKKTRAQTSLAWLRRPRSHIFAGALAVAVVIIIMIAGFAFFNPLNPSAPPAGTQPAQSSESPAAAGTGYLVLALDSVSKNSTLNRTDSIAIGLAPSGNYQRNDRTGNNITLNVGGKYTFHPPEPKGQNTSRLYLADPQWAFIELQPGGGFSWFANKTNTPLYTGQYTWTTPFRSA
jgi:TIR domain